MANSATRRNFSRLKPHKLRALVRCLRNCEDWDALINVLSDLTFVEASCAAGHVSMLAEAYREALNSLPETRQEQAARRCRAELIDKYVQSLTTDGEALPPPESSISVPNSNCSATRKQIAQAPSRVEVLRAFAEFVGAESGALQRYGTRPGFCVQQALKTSASGPVNRAAQLRLTSLRATPIVWEHEATRPPLAPQRALRHSIHLSGAYVNTVAMSASGRRAVTGGRDGTLRCWDVAAGSHEVVASIERASVVCVAMTPDGTRVVSGDNHGQLTVWDMDSRSLVWRTKAHDDRVTTVAISGDGRRACTGGVDRLVRVWDLAKNCPVATLSQPKQFQVESIAMTTGGRFAVSAHVMGEKAFEGYECSLNLWDLEKQTLVRNLFPPMGIRCVSMNPAGSVVVCGDSKGRLLVWDSESPKPAHDFEAHSCDIASLAMTADGRHVIVLDGGGELAVWDWRTEKRLWSVRGHFLGRSIATSLDATVVVTVGGLHQDEVRIWAPGNSMGTSGARENWGSADVVTLVPKHDRITAIIGDRFSSWSLSAGRHLDTYDYPVGLQNSTSLSSSSGGSVAVGLDEECRTHIWRIGDGAPPRRFGGPQPVAAFEITANGEHALTSWFDGATELWDVESETPICRPFYQRHAPSWIQLLTDNRHVVGQGDDHALRIWDIHAGTSEVVLLLSKGSRCAAFTLDERLAVVSTGTGLWRVADVALGAWRSVMGREADHCSNFLRSPDGRRVITYGDSYEAGQVCVWSLRTGERLREFRMNALAHATLSRDGRLLLTHDIGGIVRVWSLESGDCLGVCYESRGARSISQVLPDGRFAIGCSTGEVAVFELRNIPQETPYVTGVVHWRFEGPGKQAGWDTGPTALCPWCEENFAVAASVTDAIAAIHEAAALPPDAAPCVDLPDEAWEDPRLPSSCPECRRPVRFNPFLVDRRDGITLGHGDRRDVGSAALARVPVTSATPEWACCRCGTAVAHSRGMIDERRVLCRACIASLIDAPVSTWLSGGDSNPKCACCGETEWDHARDDGHGLMCRRCLEAMWESESHATQLDRGPVESSVDALVPRASHSDRLSVLWRCKEVYASATAADPHLGTRFLKALAANVGLVEDHPFSRSCRMLAIEGCVAIGRDVLPFLFAQRKGEPWQVRSNTALAVGRMDPSDHHVREILENAARDDVSHVRAFVPSALFHCESPWARGVAEALADDAERFVVDAALWLLDAWDMTAGVMSPDEKSTRETFQRLWDENDTPEFRARFPQALFPQRGTWARVWARKLARDGDAEVRSEARKLLEGWHTGVDPWLQPDE